MVRDARRTAVGGGLAGLLLLFLGAAPRPVGAEAPNPYAERGWELGQAVVVEAGRVVPDKRGTRVEGYVVEAAAEALDPATPIPKGKFRIAAAVFSPKRDMTGQKAGRWYLRGDWEIVDPAAGEQARKARHSASVVRGTLLAELGFNPTRAKGSVSAAVRLADTLVRGRPQMAQGVLTGNEKFEGALRVGPSAVRANEEAR